MRAGRSPTNESLVRHIKVAAGARESVIGDAAPSGRPPESVATVAVVGHARLVVDEFVSEPSTDADVAVRPTPRHCAGREGSARVISSVNWTPHIVSPLILLALTELPFPPLHFERTNEPYCGREKG